jgi:hypothetical protein
MGLDMVAKLNDIFGADTTSSGLSVTLDDPMIHGADDVAAEAEG